MATSLRDDVGALSRRLPGRGLGHLPFIAAIMTVTAAAFSVVASFPPFALDDLFALSIGRLRTLGGLLTEPFGSAPGYRPLPYMSLWAEYRLVGLDGGAAHFYLFEIGAWAAIAAAAYLLFDRLCGSRLAAGFAALLLALDFRAEKVVPDLSERQTILALLFGTVALALVVPASGARLGRARLGALFALLLAAMLSKEYGAAFALATVVAVLVERGPHTRQVLAVAAGAVGVYLLMRFALAGGATQREFCEETGFFFESARYCWSGTDGVVLNGLDKLTHAAYNVGATFIGSFLPFLFEADGSIAEDWIHDLRPTSSPSGAQLHIVLYVAATAAAVFAWVRWPRRSLPLLALVVGNAALSVVLYRWRNHVVGLVGIFGAAALALAHVARRLAARLPAGRLRSAAAAAAGALLVATVWWQATERNRSLSGVRTDLANGPDACAVLERNTSHIDATVVAEINRQYADDKRPCHTR